MAKSNFVDAHGRTITNNANVYFEGKFPESMPAEKRIRHGIVQIIDGILVFFVFINERWRSNGLYWELDGEPCYDIIVLK